MRPFKPLKPELSYIRLDARPHVLHKHRRRVSFSPPALLVLQTESAGYASLPLTLFTPARLHVCRITEFQHSHSLSPSIVVAAPASSCCCLFVLLASFPLLLSLRLRFPARQCGSCSCFLCCWQELLLMSNQCACLLPFKSVCRIPFFRHLRLVSLPLSLSLSLFGFR